MTSSFRTNAYTGSRRKIVLAFDVGTTYSGISYSILDPGQLSGINAVTRFPAQETISGASKIPTLIYYDQQGNVMAVGAEATKEGVHEASLEDNWYKAEWFKLHLRSKFGDGRKLHPSVPPLPPNKTVVDVFADFLRYLLHCAATYIQNTHSNGSNLWTSLKDDIVFVLSHPNGWEGREQNQMRKAAVKAGLVPDTELGHSRITFVSEGEASLHFAIENGVLLQAMGDKGVVIVDAGGGTIDVSTYQSVLHGKKRTFEEISVPRSYFQGSVFVTLNAMDHLQGLLVDSPYVQDIDHISQCFDKTTKPRFRNASDPQFVKFGSTRDNDPTCGIRFGQLKIAGPDVAKFFQPAIDCIVQAVKDQMKTSSKQISHAILVGGFAANDWLFDRVNTILSRDGLIVSRPENYVSKAVSDGGVSFYLDHHVRTRVAKVTYGVTVSTIYNESDPEHSKRSDSTIIDIEGKRILQELFSPVLRKNTQISETKEFIRPISEFATDYVLKYFNLDLICYRGSEKKPKWMDTEPDNYTTVCRLVADLSQIPKRRVDSTDGQTYYSVRYDVVLLFGLTELKAQLRWVDAECGDERRSPATLIYDDES